MRREAFMQAGVVRGYRSLQWWQRALVVAVVLGALVICAGLIYYGPRVQTAAPAIPAMPATATTPGPIYPPGINVYYYWGQSQPLSQQP
ncbi:MAG: hypothetical protein ABI901_00795 [Roseiflexaceae bacterium]